MILNNPTPPDLLQLLRQPRQELATLKCRGRLQPLGLQRRWEVGIRLPDLHLPLLRKQQPAQPGTVGDLLRQG
jgi:hypothetical protein